jgi:hypothetical protein
MLIDWVIRRVVPQPTEWQHIGNQIDATFVAAWADFVNVHGMDGGWHQISAIE